MRRSSEMELSADELPDETPEEKKIKAAIAAAIKSAGKAERKALRFGELGGTATWSMLLDGTACRQNKPPCLGTNLAHSWHSETGNLCQNG